MVGNSFKKLYKKLVLCFTRDFKHLETIKALGLRPRAFIHFLVFGTPDETLTLVSEFCFQKRLPL